MQPNPYQPPTGPGGDGGGGAGRLTKTAIIGGLIGGALSSIPLLGSLFNCCFCMLNMGGAAIGISMYLKEHPGEKLSNGDAAISGAISGGVAGVITSIVGFIMALALGSILAGLYRGMPGGVGRIIAQSGAQGVATVMIYPPLYAAFGALGGFLSMQLFFKDRLKQ